MARIRVNWPLMVVIAMALSVLILVASALRDWQVDRMRIKTRQAGLNAWQQQNWDDAAKNFRYYLAVNPSDIDILLKFASCQLNIRPLSQGDIQQTVAAYRSVLRFDNRNAAAAENLINLYLQLNVPAEAQLVAEKYLQFADDPKIRTLLAISLSKQDKFTEAAMQLQSVITSDPSFVTAYETLARLKEQHFEKLPGVAEPCHWFDEAIKSNPDAAGAFIGRAAFYFRHNDRTKAMADLEQAENLNISASKIRLQLAAQFINARLLDKARTHLSVVRRVDPGNPELWQTWARLAIAGASKDEMLRVAQDGLQQLASCPWDFMPVACELFISCGRLDDAARCIEALNLKDITPVQTAFLEALLAQANKQDNKVISLLLRAIQLGDKSEQTKLMLAKAYFRTGNYQSAILQMQTLVAETSQSVENRIELARLLSQMGNWADSERQALEALKIAPGNVDATLIFIEAKMHRIDAKENAGKNEVSQSLKKQLAELSEKYKNHSAIMFLQFQLAMKMNDYALAEQLLENLKCRPDLQIEASIFEVDMLIAQAQIDQAIKKLYVLADKFPQNVLTVKYMAFLLGQMGSRDDCEKVLTGAIRRIENPSAKRELGFVLEYFYKQWNQNDKAYAYLTRLSQQMPDDISLKRKLLTYTQPLKDSAGAQNIIDEIKSLEGEQGWQWRYEQANLWLAGSDFRKHYSQTIALLKENITANSADKMSLVLLAQVYQKGGEPQLSAETYRRALNRWPDDISLISQAVATLYQAGEYQQAYEILDVAAKEGVNNPQILQLQAHGYLRSGKFDSAETVLENLIASEPNSYDLALTLALLKMRQNKFDQASELLNRLKAKQSESFMVASAMVELNALQKKEKETIELCNDMVKRFGNASVYLIRAKAYAMFGDSSSAEKDFKQAVALEPDDAQAWEAKSEFELFQGHTEQAVKSIEKAFSLMPENTQIQEHAVGILLSSSKPDKVRIGSELLDKALSANPQNTTLRLYKARSLIAQANSHAIEQAKSILEQIISEQPAVSQAWTMLAQIYLKHSQPGIALDKILRGLAYSPDDKTLLLFKARAESESSPTLALPTLKILRQRLPDDIDIALELANNYMLTSSPDKAADTLKTVLPHCKENERIKVNAALAVALYRNGNAMEAENIFDSLNKSAPSDTLVLFAQIEAFKYSQNWEKLDRMINGYFDRDPNNLDIFVTVAERLAATGNQQAVEIAGQLLIKVLARDSTHIAAMNSLAMILQSQGRNEQAAELYRKVIAMKPDAVVAVNNLAWILCENRQEYQQALALAQKGLNQSDEYIDLIDTRSVIYYRLGEYRKAAADVTKCIELYPSYSPRLVGSYFHLGRTQAALGQPAKAAESLKKAIDLSSQFGGLSVVELAEAKSILSKLSEELNHAAVTNR